MIERQNNSATIVGAGLAGSLLGVLLANNGWTVSLVEKRNDPRLTDEQGGRSINLALSTRGLYALDQAGLLDQVMALTIPMAGRMIHDESGDTSLQPYGKDSSEVIYSISRSGLNEILLDACDATGNVNIEFGLACAEIDARNKTVVFADSVGNRHTRDANILIGCDGAGSAVRQELERTEGIHSRSDILSHGYKELSIAATEDGAHALEKEALHIWPRKSFMLIALPNLDGTFTVTLFMPTNGAVSFEKYPDASAGRKLFEEYFPDVLPLMPDFDAEYDTNPVGILGTVRCEPWSAHGFGLLVGDAAHAIVPFFGQGMNCSFEDCSYLLDAIASTGSSWPEVARAYETIRKPDTDAIATMALENYVEMRDHVADPSFVLKKQIARELESRFPDRFIPRYSMVTFHRIPYAVAMRRGKLQSDILANLWAGINDVSQVDWNVARDLVSQLSVLTIDDGLTRS